LAAIALHAVVGSTWGSAPSVNLGLSRPPLRPAHAPQLLPQLLEGLERASHPDVIFVGGEEMLDVVISEIGGVFNSPNLVDRFEELIDPLGKAAERPHLSGPGSARPRPPSPRRRRDVDGAIRIFGQFLNALES
jgi:hypothetical protein